LSTGSLADEPIRYLSFQVFTGSYIPGAMHQAIPPQPEDLGKTVLGLLNRIGTEGTDGQRIGFVIGPIAFDAADAEVR
jgi:hypothetical protein